MRREEMRGVLVIGDLGDGDGQHLPGDGGGREGGGEGEGADQHGAAECNGEVGRREARACLCVTQNAGVLST